MPKKSPGPLHTYYLAVNGVRTRDPHVPIDHLIAVLGQRWPMVQLHPPRTASDHPLVSLLDLGALLTWRIRSDEEELDGWFRANAYAVEVAGAQSLAISFLHWYAGLVMPTYPVALASITKTVRGQRILTRQHAGMIIAATTTEQDIAVELARSPESRRAEALAAATYHLRVTKTDKRRWNKRLYRIERLEQGVAVNEELVIASELGIRLMCEPVPIHTDIRDLYQACEERGEICFWIGPPQTT